MIWIFYVFDIEKKSPDKLIGQAVAIAFGELWWQLGAVLISNKACDRKVLQHPDVVRLVFHKAILASPFEGWSDTLNNTLGFICGLNK